MGMEQRTHFGIDKSKCVRCGKCVNTCSGMVIEFGSDGYPRMKEFERFGWRGCWRCQHCLAVCPQGAISIFDKRPEDSLPPPPPEMGEYMERLVTNRRSCRRFLDKNVNPDIITRILSAMAAVPTGGNAMGVEYTVIDDKERVHEIWREAYAVMDAKARRHIFTHSFSDFYYGKMKQSEKTVRKDDLLFCGAPHLFIAHERCAGKWAEDSKVNCNIATTYFELLCNAHGLGTTVMSYSAEVLNELAPKAREMLEIPKDHYTVPRHAPVGINDRLFPARTTAARDVRPHQRHAFIGTATHCHPQFYRGKNAGSALRAEPALIFIAAARRCRHG